MTVVVVVSFVVEMIIVSLMSEVAFVSFVSVVVIVSVMLEIVVNSAVGNVVTNVVGNVVGTVISDVVGNCIGNTSGEYRASELYIQIGYHSRNNHACTNVSKHTVIYQNLNQIHIFYPNEPNKKMTYAGWK